MTRLRRCQWRGVRNGSDKGEFYDVGETGPYTLGIQYHIAWVFTPPAAAGGAWTITVYKHDAMTGALLDSHVYSPPAGWTLPAAPQNNCWLGHSLYNDYDAAATFDEVRVWKQALTEEELAASVRLGPDTTFGAPGWRTACSPPARAARRRSYIAGRSTTEI